MGMSLRERRRRDLLTPLLIALAVILVLAFWVFRPFILVGSVAACVALLLAPAQRRLTALLRGREGIASMLIVLVTTLVILVALAVSVAVNPFATMHRCRSLDRPVSEVDAVHRLSRPQPNEV